MSLAGLQNASALLIRLPDENRREGLERFLKGFELTARETSQLRALSEDPRVTRYGYSMAGVRWETLTKNIKLSKNYLAHETLSKLFTIYFEPKAVNTRLWDITPRFFDFLLTDREAAAILRKEAPPFILDVLRFERAQVSVWWKLRVKPPVSGGSLLTHTAFEIVDVEHDILDVLNRIAEAGPGSETPLPVPRQVKFLLLPQESSKECRYFEIDEALQRFLEGQLSSPPAKAGLPDCYDGLVDSGLCRPLEKGSPRS